MKVYKLEVMVVDFDELGPDNVTEVLEHTRYPNHCIGPVVMSVSEREVEWDDDHPLNLLDQQQEAFGELFG